MDLRDIGEDFKLNIYEVSFNQELYLSSSQYVGYTGGGVPLLIDGEKYVEGTDPILDYFNSLSDAPMESSNTLSSAESEELNLIAANLSENPQQQEAEEIVEPTSTTAAPDYASMALAILTIGFIIGAFRHICKSTSSP